MREFFKLTYWYERDKQDRFKVGDLVHIVSPIAAIQKLFRVAKFDDCGTLDMETTKMHLQIGRIKRINGYYIDISPIINRKEMKWQVGCYPNEIKLI